MFDRLQTRWKVNGWRLFLILVTFAVGGSLTGIAGKKLMSLTGIDHPVLYILLYVLVITIIWPLMVLTVSIPLGQFPFFKNYLARMKNKLMKRKK